MGHPIQIILTRQLATHLSVPAFLVDPEGTLLFYNEPAEAILGRRFDDTGEMPAEEWSSAFFPIDDPGQDSCSRAAAADDNLDNPSARARPLRHKRTGRGGAQDRCHGDPDHGT